MKPIWGEKDAKTLNAEYLKAHKHSIRHVLQGTRMLYYLEPQQQKIAVSLATCLDEGVEGVSIEVPRVPRYLKLTVCPGWLIPLSYFYSYLNLIPDVIFVVLQTCTDVLDALKNGDFGSCSKEAEEFRLKCQEKYPLALAFKEGGAAAAAAAAVASSTPVFNHVSPTGQENWWSWNGTWYLPSSPFLLSSPSSCRSRPTLSPSFCYSLMFSLSTFCPMATHNFLETLARSRV